MNRLLYIIIFFPIALFADEGDIIKLAKSYYVHGEYYNSITELMRYQYLYPNGTLYSESLLLMGKAYYKGDNLPMASQTMYNCYNRFPNSLDGEEALYMIGFMNLHQGSPIHALKNFYEYKRVYKKGRFSEKSDINICYATALVYDFNSSRNEIERYRSRYPDSRYLEDINKLEKLIVEEINKPMKSLLVSVLGSIFIPGFGHFYTGNYALGALSFITNAVLIFLIYNSYRINNKFQMIFFGIIELSFYQYSLFGGMRDVYEYNSREGFYKRIKFSMSASF